MAWSSQLIKANMFWTPHLDRYTETIDKVPTSRVAVEGESSEEVGSSTPLKKNQRGVLARRNRGLYFYKFIESIPFSRGE
jgi:hypothetical protein